MPALTFGLGRSRESSGPSVVPAKRKQPLPSALKRIRSKPLPPMPPPTEPMPRPPASPIRAKRSQEELANAPPAAKPRREPLSSIQAEVGSTAYTDAHFDVPAAYHTRNASAVRFKLPSVSPPPEPSRRARTPVYVNTPRSPEPRSPPATSSVRHRRRSSTGSVLRRPIGPFMLVRSLNKGAFGSAYVAQDTGSSVLMCVRVVNKQKLLADANSPILRGLLFELECHKIIAARPPEDRAHLMEMQGILQDDTHVFCVMPLMRCDLLSVIRGRCKPALTRRWVAQLALGIDALHRMGIIHRDIKPENVLLDAPNGNVRIADFNSAYVGPSSDALEDGAVYARDKVGSAPYMAYEVLQGRWYGKMVDWWSLGCLMYDLTTGSILFEKDEQRDVYVKWSRRREGTTFLQSRVRGMSEEEESVIAGLIKLSPSARFQLSSLRHHAFFFDEHHANVFDVLEREAPVDLLTAGRPVRPDEFKVEDRLKDRPLINAKQWPSPADPRDGYDFHAFAWANPHGVWRT